MAAAEAAGDASRYPEAGEPWTPARVFWSVIPRSFFEERRKAMEAQGQDVSGMLERAQRMGWADDQVTTWLDVSPWVEQKHDAVYSHRSQLNPNSPVLRQSPEDRKKAMGREAFILAWPSTEAPPEARDDLFGGLDA
jgi:LmbE family N-acetylglucosaminyl deacetylase